MIDVDTDLEALCAAIDGGDDAALPILADWLEERGHDTSRLREVIEEGKRPQPSDGRHWWRGEDYRQIREHPPAYQALLTRETYARLTRDRRAEIWSKESYVEVRPYSSRSRAFLALVLPTL